MSDYSPGIVGHEELLTRFVFMPMYRSVNGKVKPAFFDQIHTSGCSLQREAFATHEEIGSFVSEFLNGDSRRAWIGVTSATCESIRKIRLDDSLDRAICVYDTAVQQNPSHGELFCAGRVSDEADRLELRHSLWTAFNEGAISAPQSYRDGVIWADMPQAMRARPV